MIEVENPATGAIVGSVPELSAAQVGALVERAREAQPEWRRVGFDGRARVMREARRLLLRDAEGIARTIVSETGKAWEDAQLAEFGVALNAFGHWARHAARDLAEQSVRSFSPAALGKRLRVRYEPFGVVGLITPWNTPLAIPIDDGVPALMAGNAVVLKPSEVTPMTALRIERLLLDAGVPEGVFAVATGRGDTGEAVIDACDAITFTGSTRTGRKVMERAARTLTPVSLELGGNDAAIVLADADLERAANAIAYHAMMNAGQICISVERVYVEEEVHDEFVTMLVDRIGALRQGDPSAGPGTVDVGATATAAQLEIVKRHVADAVERGGAIRVGGGAGNGRGHFHEPTVITDADHEMQCMREETFGPTLPIVAVGDAEEAIALANDSQYGLGATVFTRNAERGESIARRIEAGCVTVNDPNGFYALPGLPMGGWKQSGIGKRHGPEGIRKYCRQQSLVVAGRGLKREPHWYPVSRLRTAAMVRTVKLLFGRRR